jgi:hypothetical protein
MPRPKRAPTPDEILARRRAIGRFRKRAKRIRRQNLYAFRRYERTGEYPE